MIDLYTWPTSNGHKVHIMLEECGLPYTAHAVCLGAGEQFEPEFLKFSPNNKTPAMIDHDGPGGEEVTLFESGAILLYLSEKTGCFMPKEGKGRYDVIQWLMFQMASVGPMLGQAHFFIKYGPDHFDDDKLKIGQDRYRNEANRIYNVLDKRLKDRTWIATDEYTIADMAIWPWLRAPQFQGVDIDDYPNVKRWQEVIGERSSVKKALTVLQDNNRLSTHNDQEWEIMFGSIQYQRR